jgi:SNF2 family DNA or RNA helicase
MRINVVGGDWQKEEIAKALRHLTVLPRKTKDGSGELSLPLTWAVVTQCSALARQRGFKWRPCEELNQWIVDEFTRRFTEYQGFSDLKMDLSGMTREPMPHQLSGAFTGAMNKRFFFGDAAGTGKTMTALLTIAELDARGDDPWPVFVVTPASVVDPWLEELQKCFPDWTFTAYRGTKRKQLSSRYQVYVMSWDVFRRDMYPTDKADCERCGDRIEWTKAHQNAYEIFQGKGPRKGEAKEKADKLVLHHDCPKILPSKGYSVYRPIDTDKHELPPLLEFNVPKTIVLDEAHVLCNKTKQSVAAKRIARVVPYVFPMSGTAIMRDIAGFHTAMNVLDIQSFPDQDRYQARYCDRSVPDYGRPEIEGLTSVNREEFYVLMQGTMRYVAKADVLKDLPPKMYSTRAVEIPAAHRAAYDEMEEDMIAHIPDTDEPLPVMNTLAQMQRLTQLASSACDVEIEMVLDENIDSPTCGEMVPHYKVTMREPCWKVDELMRLKEGEYNDEPLLVFAPHTQLVNLAGARAEKAGYRVGYIKGGQTSKQRTATRIAFQDGKLDMLCANTQAGGVGLTLHRAHTSVFLERSYAFWREDQAEDRTHRAGQTEQVHIIDIVAINTIESRVRETLKGKAGQLADLVRDPRIVRSFLGGQKIRV